jgi:superfamily II DNA or RNA helicase
VGFFSSSALETVGQPLIDLIWRGGEMRLVTSVCLEEEDIKAIELGLDRKKICETRLLEQLKAEFTVPLGKGTMLLAALLEMGSLSIRIAIPKSGRGIYHEKVGIFLDELGDYVSFSGSSNESRFGLEFNYECVDVYTSWQELGRALAKRRHFEILWEGRAPGVETLEFPDAVKQELIRRYHESAATSPEIKPYISEEEELWEHQRDAVRLFLENKRGVLEMATGTGKTRTALHICRKLLQLREIDTIIVSTDGTDLLDQWYTQLLELVSQMPQSLAIHRDYGVHRQRDRFLLNKSQAILLVSRQVLPPALKRISRNEATRTLLIHDEVHGLGSTGNRTNLAGLSDNMIYRLGLSATPEREYDQEGNDFIESHIGPILMRFGLEDAIRRGILAPFNYYPIEYIPDTEDRGRLQQVHRKAAARNESGNPMSQEEIWIELARVYKTSRVKLPLFSSFIRDHQELLRRCIIFVETKEYGDDVLSIIHRYRHDFHTYYSDEDSSILKQFADGQLECLLTCHRLSEGIDIRSIENVILFSSSRARLETIQRIGRCLRTRPEDPQKRANVVDFVRIPHDESKPDDPNADQDRRDWLIQLSMVKPEGQEQWVWIGESKRQSKRR